MLAILDYKAGNQTSVQRALEHLSIAAIISADPAVIARADGIIFPGVGAAGQAMAELRKSGLDKILREQVEHGKPLLGICLGCQIMLDRSAENATQTLGIVPGQCVRFADDLRENGRLLRIPHMGWNTLNMKKQSLLFAGIAKDAAFYFVHSYYAETAPENIIATSTYGIEFCAAYGHDGLWAVQFHPEKSGEAGLRLLANFHAFCTGQRRAPTSC